MMIDWDVCVKIIWSIAEVGALVVGLCYLRRIVAALERLAHD